MPAADRGIPERRAAVAIAGLVLALAGCTTVVTPPPEPEDPVPVFLLDNGRHASLVIPYRNGLVRYAYGEWDWYAANDTGVFRASGVLFTTGRGALGRRVFDGPLAMETVRRVVRVPIEQGWAIRVPGAKRAALVRDLERIFERAPDEHLHNPLYDLTFAPHPDRYNAATRNSNHAVIRWLQALGCQVDVGGPFSIWRVEAAD